jgi:pimeloyl-ACP methyl ester carboxylesterase
LKTKLILVPVMTELEWRIKPRLEEWADVASYDAPGVGDEPPPEEFTQDAVIERGLTEIDRLGWDRYVVVGDEFGTFNAAKLAAARPEQVAGLVLGHACLALKREGDRPAVNAEVMGAFEGLARLDYRTYVRHLTQVTQGAYDDEFAEQYIDRVPQEVALAYPTNKSGEIESLLRRIDAPLLVAKHEGCLGWRDEAFEDVITAFPDAVTFSTALKPSVCEQFAEALRSFCERLDS